MAKEAAVIAKKSLGRLCCWLDRNDVATPHGNGTEHEEMERRDKTQYTLLIFINNAYDNGTH